MPRDLADVLHYFLPELEESPAAGDASPSPTPRRRDLGRTGEDAQDRRPAEGIVPPLPVLGLAIGDRDVVRAALAWNLAIETARLGGTTVILAPEEDRGSPLWPEAGIGPLGTELLFCPAKDLRGLYEAAADLAQQRAQQRTQQRTQQRAGQPPRGGIIFVRIPPAWLEAQDELPDVLRWVLMLSGSSDRELDESLSLCARLLARHPKIEIGVTLHGVQSIAEARSAYEILARRAQTDLGLFLISYGLLVDDLHVYRAIAAQRPIGLAHPQAPAARALMDVARLLYEDARSRVLG